MNKIIAKMRDLVGVVLFGTEKSDPETKTSNVTLLQELNYPGAPAIKKLEELLQGNLLGVVGSIQLVNFLHSFMF